MLDYNTLNNLVEFFNKNGIKNIQLETGSTIEVKEGSLLVNGEEVGGAEYTAGDGISIENNTVTNTRKLKCYQIRQAVNYTQISGYKRVELIMSIFTYHSIQGTTLKTILNEVYTGGLYSNPNPFPINVALRLVKDDDTSYYPVCSAYFRLIRLGSEYNPEIQVKLLTGEGTIATYQPDMSNQVDKAEITFA